MKSRGEERPEKRHQSVFCALLHGAAF